MTGTPCKDIWGSIEYALYQRKVTKKELSRITGIHVNTITRDSKEPERIPLGRLCLYLVALDVQADAVADSISTNIRH